MRQSHIGKSDEWPYSALRCGCFCIFILLIPCIIWGSISASSYVRYRNIRKNYNNTTCTLLNYTVLKHECTFCASQLCSSNTCFNEQFLVTYPISNKTYITSIFVSFDKDKIHQQSQV